MDLEDLTSDLSAFADSDEDVAVERSGQFVLLRGGEEIAGRLVTKDLVDFVDLEGALIPYRRFITHTLGRLDVFAERLIGRRQPIQAFVDGPVHTRRPGDPPKSESAVEALAHECSTVPPFAARVTFITADAGHGKTALLREHQYKQAIEFAGGRGSYLFWHVDLQGRQLLRLSEALMGDIGDLRLTGLWMPGVIRLMKMRALVLAIDGFDELAAEQGGTDALGALASLVSQLGGSGVVVAAARRTFFDTSDYLRRAGLLARALTSPCEFDEISLLPWTETQGVAYLTKLSGPDGNRFSEPELTYIEISEALGDSDGHPMVTRPFLLSQVARALLSYGITAAEFLRGAENPHKGVDAVVEAFVKREVEQKWVYSDTGEPYLTVAQHMQLLADVAEEMYRSQKDRLDLEVIETIATLLVDDWGIEPTRRHQVLQMVRMHVLLVIPPETGGDRQRSFDHPEFRDFFVAEALRARIEEVMNGADASALARYLTIAQMSDSVARYVCQMVERNATTLANLLHGLETVISTQWKPTFLQANAGTLIACALDGVDASHSPLTFSGRAVISSLSLERSRVSDVTISGCMFVNASLAGAEWRNVVLDSCNLGNLTVDQSASFENVTFRDCAIESVRLNSPDDDYVQEFAPERIRARLSESGITMVDQTEQLALDMPIADSPFQDMVRKVLRLFNRTTVIGEHLLEQRFREDKRVAISEVLPLMERYKIVKEKTWRGAGTARIWNLHMRLDDVLEAEGRKDGTNAARFWLEVAAR